ncbi:MAG: PKD domain-containing protein [Bacteroidia bacterium]
MFHHVLFSAMVAMATLWAAPSPWTNWQIFSPSNPNRVCDTVKVRIDTTGMGAAGITSYKVLAAQYYHTVVYPSGGDLYTGITNEDTIIFKAGRSDVLILRVYNTNGDSAESVLAFTKVSPSSLFLQTPPYACPGAQVPISVDIYDGFVDSFWVVEAANPNTPLAVNEYHPTLTAPATPGTLQLRVKAFAGSCVTLSYPTTITIDVPSNWLGVFSITNLLGTSTSCAGDSIYFQLYNSPGILIDSVKWELSGNNAYDDGKGIRVGYKYMAPYTGQIYAQVYVRGCSGPVTVGGPSVNIQSSLSAISLTASDISLGSGDYCVGTPRQIFCTVGGIGYQYEWDWDGNGSTDETTSSNYVFHAFSSASGSFNVRIRDILNSCRAGNPTNWISKSYNFTTTNPKPSFYVSLTPSSSDGCSEIRLQIFPQNNFSLSNGQIFVDFSGSGNNYQSITTLDTTFTPPNPNPGSYSVSVFLQNSCGIISDTTPTFYFIQSSPNFPLPNISPSSVCPGGTVTFEFTNNMFSTRIDSVRWNFGDGSPEVTALSGEEILHMYPTTPPETTYAVRARIYYCGGNHTDRYYTVSVRNSVPPPAALGNVFPTTACENQNIFVSLFSSSIQSAESVAVWVGNNRVPLTGNFVSFSLPTAGNYTVYLIAYPRSCAPTGTQPDTLKIPITVIPGVTAQFTGPSAACVGDSVTFTHNSPGGIGYGWNFGDGNTSSSPSSTVTHVYTAPGTYNVSLNVNSPSCGSTSEQKTLTIYQGSPTASITSLNLSGTTLSYAGSATNYASIEWVFGDGNTSTSLSGTHTYTSSGPYTVKLRAFNPCDTVEVSQSITVTSFATLSAAGVRLYPNPSTGTFTVEIPQSWQSATLRVLDLQGKLLHQASLTQSTTQLSLSLPQGLYQLQILGSQASETLRLVIQN